MKAVIQSSEGQSGIRLRAASVLASLILRVLFGRCFVLERPVRRLLFFLDLLSLPLAHSAWKSISDRFNCVFVIRHCSDAVWEFPHWLVFYGLFKQAVLPLLHSFRIRTSTQSKKHKYKLSNGLTQSTEVWTLTYGLELSEEAGILR